MITVSKNGEGDYTSIQQAIDNLHDEKEIFIKNGIYDEVVSLRRDDVIIRGESRENTIITHGNSAKMKDENGEPLGTFRSYTFIALGDNITLENMSIINSAGSSPDIGQAVALYTEGDMITVRNCQLSGHQDTLFVGPLPMKANSAKGFLGPTENFPRVLRHQLFENCIIEGDVDFIFGSAVAYFDNCIIRCLDRKYTSPGGYIAAPSTYEGYRYGFVFNHCKIVGEDAKERFYLARPWRMYAKIAILNSEIGDCIMDCGYSPWNKDDYHETVGYVEYNNTGVGSKGPRVPFVKFLTEEESLEYTKEKVMAYTLEEL